VTLRCRLCKTLFGDVCVCIENFQHRWKHVADSSEVSRILLVQYSPRSDKLNPKAGSCGVCEMILLLRNDSVTS
jgi:hypothetical protein